MLGLPTSETSALVEALSWATSRPRPPRPPRPVPAETVAPEATEAAEPVTEQPAFTG
ncbi:MAG: hypothetical protein U5R31_10045 [Acidimicrobiia bacterium]|nr:hypothetical protein [Acidimicrobiia bacterium]